MKTPKISIIMPCYNVADYLDQCLKSIQNQTLKEIEIVCVDDKSTDNTVTVLRSYANQDPRIKVLVKEQNEGSGKSRNFGIDNASGDYVVFMDPDDYYPYDTTLEKLYIAVTENDVKIAGGNLIKLASNGTKTIKRFVKNGVYSFYENPFPYGYTLFIYNRDFLIKNKLCFPDYRRFQDPVFFVNAMIKADKYYAMTDTVYVYRVNYKQIDWTEQKALDTLNGLCDILALSKQHKVYKLYIELIKILWNDISGIYEHIHSMRSVTEKIIDIFKYIDSDILLVGLKKKLDYKKCYCDVIKSDEKIYKKWKPFIKWPALINRIFYKKRLLNGHRCIYFCGVKIFEYIRKGGARY